MKIYRVTTDQYNYDEHNGFVVAANSFTEARQQAAETAGGLGDSAYQWGNGKAFLDAGKSNCKAVGTYTGPLKNAHVILESFCAG